MKLSVVILNYNVRYFLELCLCSVHKAIQNLEAEIIVVDNASPDDSCQMVKALFPKVVLIENKQNSGFPKGNNIGVAAAKGEFVCILNPDTVVAEDTFEKILAFAALQQNLGIIGCKLIDGSGNFLPESKRGLPTAWVSFTRISGLYKLSPKWFGKYYNATLGENQTGKTDILVGAFLLLQRSLYQELGGFDERFFMYGEDIDFSYRALLAGKSNCYFAGTSVIHYKGESTVKDAVYRQRFTQGMDLFYKKHFGGAGFLSFLMSFAMVAFSKIKAAEQNKKMVAHAPQNLVLVSENLEKSEALSLKLGKPVQSAGTDFYNKTLAQSFSKNNTAQLIFDADSAPFKTIIAAFEFHSKPGISFRILLQPTDFLIGSDNSSGRGEVIRLSEKS